VLHPRCWSWHLLGRGQAQHDLHTHTLGQFAASRSGVQVCWLNLCQFLLASVGQATAVTSFRPGRLGSPESYMIHILVNEQAYTTHC
jgi:hypothetical protein